MSVRKTRSVSVVLVVAVALLAVSAQPVGAASAGLVVASQHTTTSDFEAGELTGLTATDGKVVLPSGSTVDTFDDGDISEYSGDTGSFETVSSPSVNGQALHETTGTSPVRITSTSGLNYYPEHGDTITYRTRFSEDRAKSGFLFGVQSGSPQSSGYLINLNNQGNALEIEKDGEGSELATTATDFPENEWLTVTVDWESDGTISATVDDSSGSTIATVSASDTTYTDGGVGYYMNTDTSSTDVYWDEVEARNPATSGTYVSQNHSVDNAEEAAINITEASNVSVDITVEYYDGSSWVTANETAVTTAANHTLALPNTASSTWRVSTDVSSTGSDPAFELADESILFDARAPSGDLESPSDGAKLTESSVDFTINVTDPDFGTAQGDTVNATLFVDGEIAAYQTTTSNGTVTVSDTISGGGEHTYYWTLTDSYGESTTTATRTINTPSELRIYNETDSSELLNQTTFDVTLYFDNGSGPAIVEERTVSDGVVNLTGLPASESFVVAVEADGWVNRRIVVPSIYDTERIYMLNSSESTVPVVFKLEDLTGNFPQGDTVLLVQRGINGTYQTVVGDQFGATGQFPAELATGARHRLVLLNTETGERRPVGAYTPLAGGEQTITVSPSGGISVVDTGLSIAWIPGTDLVPATDNATLGARVDTRSVTITDWSISATHVPPSGTNTTLWTYSTSADGGRATTTANLSGLNGTVVLDINYQLSTGVSDSRQRVLTLQAQSNAFSYSLLGQLDSAPGALLPTEDVSAFTTGVSLLLTVLSMAVIATATGTTSELTAGSGVLILAGFSVIGWVGYPLVTVTGVAWIGMTAIRRGVI